MSPTRIKGRKLALEFDGIDYWTNFGSILMDNEENDDDQITFEDHEMGGAYRWFFDLTAVQSTGSDSFWAMCWDHTGEDVAFTFAPHGNETPTEEQPHFVGTVKVGPRPPVGGEAGETWTFERRWWIEGVPVKDTGTP